MTAARAPVLAEQAAQEGPKVQTVRVDEPHLAALVQRLAALAPAQQSAAMWAQSACRLRYGEGRTLLHFIAVQGLAGLVAPAVDAGLGVNVQDDQGSTALHLVCEHNTNLAENAKFLDTLCCLLGTDVDLDRQNVIGATALMRATSMLQIQSMRMLHQAGASLHCPNMDRPTLLHFATGDGGLDREEAQHFGALAVKQLIAWDVPVDVPGTDGRTPLHRAIRHGLGGSADRLIRAGAQVNCHDGVNRLTPLHYAAKDSRIAETLLLLHHGADLRAQDNQGITARQQALAGGHKQWLSTVDAWVAADQASKAVEALLAAAAQSARPPGVRP